MFSFKLSDEFIAQYKNQPVDWGFKDAAGNALGEITFLRTYSRLKEDGTKERWYEVCRRVVEGMYSIQKDHVKSNRLPWNDNKAQKSAQYAFDAMFNFKWTPPGRGIFMMGTPLVMEQRNSAALQNCSFISTLDMTKNDPAYPFSFLMEASMLGVGVGFDTRGSEKDFDIYEPKPDTTGEYLYVVPDTREGWVESTKRLINSYLKADRHAVSFDYSEVRPAGTIIKTFGGTAAGPDPLIKLHDGIRKIFKKRAGSKIGTMDIMDIANLIGICVVSGNVRRSAELAMGSLDDEAFLNSKNYGHVGKNGNWVEGPAAKRQEWGWMSNNSVGVKVGDDLSKIVPLIQQNGEPGVIWLDVTRNYGRLVDAPDGKDWRVAGFNPCVTADTWVQTSMGARQVSELIGKKFKAVVDGKEYNTVSNGFWLTGNDRQVFNLVTDSGWEAKVTENHKILTANRGWVEASELVTGDEIVVNNHKDIKPWSGLGEYSEGYLMGHLWGDGTLKSDTAVLSVWGKDGEAIRNSIQRIAEATLNTRSDWTGFNEVAGRDEWRLKSADLLKVANSWGMTQGGKKIGAEIERASFEFYRGFIQAAFDTDGHIEGNQEKGVSIRLSQSDKEQLQRVQRMLGRMGILSKVRLTREERVSEIYGKSFNAKASYRLIISGANAAKFMETIGFMDDVKTAKWNRLTATMSKGFYSKPATAKFVELVPAGFEDVYDVTVDEVHAFDANGLYVHNCAEQPLESQEMCTLVEVHLNRHTDLEDLKRTLKVAYLYGKTITLLPTHWDHTNAIMQRNRRIGLSMSGIANFADNRGLPVLKDWMDKGYHFVDELDGQYSEWLCVRESIRMTTVKPSGSVSILSGESPGVHWQPGGEYFNRGIVFSKDDPMVFAFQQAGYKVEKSAYTPETSVFVQFPIHSGAKRSEKDVSIFEKAQLAATAQRYWSDNGVSVTISFNPETEAKYIGNILSSFEGQFKAVSFLPSANDTYKQMPYQDSNAKEHEKKTMELFPIDWSPIYDGTADFVLDASGEKYCTTDFCEVKVIKNENDK